MTGDGSRAEGAAQESNAHGELSREHLLAAQALGHVGSWELDLHTGLVSATTEAPRIFGFDPNAQQVPLEEVETCIPERERVHQALVGLVDRGAPSDVTFEIVPRDSSPSRTVAAVGEAHYDAAGTPIAVIGVMRDVTAERRAEEALLASEERFRLLSSNTPDIMSVQDRELRYEWVVNPALA